MLTEAHNLSIQKGYGLLGFGTISIRLRGTFEQMCSLQLQDNGIIFRDM